MRKLYPVRNRHTFPMRRHMMSLSCPRTGVEIAVGKRSLLAPAFGRLHAPGVVGRVHVDDLERPV